MSEYLEHLAQENAMASSTLSTVLRQQTMLGPDKSEQLTCRITCGETEVETDDIQDVSFSDDEIIVSFFAGLNTVSQAQRFHGLECNVTCYAIESDNVKCTKWSVSKVSPAAFLVTLKFQNSL